MRPEGNDFTTTRAPDGASDRLAATMPAEADEAGAAAAKPATLDDLVGVVAVQVRAQASRILELELALADAEARILSQARLICGATAEANSDLFERRPVRAIIEEVLGAYPGVRFEEIIGVGRERRLVEPRHRCMTAVYDERPDLSLPALGRIFRRDHTSVLHAVNKREPGDIRQRGRAHRPGRPLADGCADGTGAPAL
ncbi:helix-turn-helix domain-containing protein [Ensifer adhaerens]|uniref:helix-turn-helix domain-containing protein n=1 Tax=Ensifer adhaerens TaxID=106592 RepID=UPI0015C3CB20|nr:helix-turn-helix domain-containing protein [Ensifer adhaerens]